MNLSRREFLASAVLAVASPVQAEEPLSALIEQLGDRTFKIRDRAQKKIEALLTRDGVYEELCKGHRDPEIDHRLGLLRQKYLAALLPSNCPMPLWIDSLPAGHPNRNDVINEYLTKSTAPGSSPIWPRYMEAAQIYFDDLRKNGMSPKELAKLMHDMGEVQKKTSCYAAYMQAMRTEK